MPRARRAPPLPPDERRRAIIDAVVPLLMTSGPNVTTRQMAEAAGVAEGTLFTVFDDKAALVLGAIEQRLDPRPVAAAIAAAADDEAELAAKLRAAAAAVLPRIDEATALAHALRALPPHRSGASRQGAARRAKPTSPSKLMLEWAAAIEGALRELVEPHADELRMAPTRVAAVFGGLLFASRAPLLQSRERLSSDELVDLLLHGVAAGKGEA